MRLPPTRRDQASYRGRVGLAGANARPRSTWNEHRLRQRAGSDSSSSSSSSSRGSGTGSGSDSGSGSGTGSQPPAAGTQKFVLNHEGGAGALSYTMGITIGSQTLPVQVDTGSSDLFLASTRCRDDPCQGGANGEVTLLKTKSTSSQGPTVTLSYPQGTASGPVVTVPSMYFGSGNQMRIDSQAFASATHVDNLQLGPGNFTGMLGLSPPAGSRVQGSLYDQSGNDNPGNDIDDYRSTGSVLPGLLHGIPLTSRYFAVGLQRLPSEGGKGDSTLIFGGVDPNYVSAINQVHTERVAAGPRVAVSDNSDSDDSDLVDDPTEQPRWRTYVRGLSIDVGGSNSSIPFSSTVGAQYPLAVFSSAAPYSLAPTNFLNAFYGAYGYQPSSDGGYYVPCNKMLNLTLNLGQEQVAVPIHPFDLNLRQELNGGSSSSYCLGGFQAINGPRGNLHGTTLEGADMVIGAAMMRSMYSIFACGPTDGSSGSTGCTPSIGFHPLVNMTQAQDEFHQVRVLGHSLGKDGKKHSGSKGMSAGIKALIGVLCSVAGIMLIMLAVLLWMRRQRKQRHAQAMALKMQSRESKPAAPGAPGSVKPSTPGEVEDKNLGSLRPGVPTAHSRISGDSFHSPAESIQSNWTGHQLEHARQINLMNGVFDEEVGQPGDETPEALAAAGVAANFGTPQEGDVEINSTQLDPNDPYHEAKKIKGAYLKKHPSFERKSSSHGGNPFGSDSPSPPEESSGHSEGARVGAVGAVGLAAAGAMAASHARTSPEDGEVSNPFASQPPSREHSNVGDKSEASESVHAHDLPAQPSQGTQAHTQTPQAAVAAPAAAPVTQAAEQPKPSPVTMQPLYPSRRGTSDSSSAANSAYISFDEPRDHDWASEPAARAAFASTEEFSPVASDSQLTQPTLAPVPVHPLAATTREAPAPTPVPVPQPTPEVQPQAQSQTPADAPPVPPQGSPQGAAAKPLPPMEILAALPPSSSLERTTPSPRSSTSTGPTRKPVPQAPSPSKLAPSPAAKAADPASTSAPIPAPIPATTAPVAAPRAPVPTQSATPPAPTQATPAPAHQAHPAPAPVPYQTTASDPTPHPLPASTVAPVPVSNSAPLSPPPSTLAPGQALAPAPTQDEFAQSSTVPPTGSTASAPNVSSPLRPIGPRSPPASTRSPPASIRLASGPSPPRANLMSPPSMRAASGPPQGFVPDLFFDPALLPPPMTGGQGGNALAHRLYRATAGTNSPFNPSGSVSGQATPRQWSPTSSWNSSPMQSFTPAQHVRMQPAFMRMNQQPEPDDQGEEPRDV